MRLPTKERQDQPTEGSSLTAGEAHRAPGAEHHTSESAGPPVDHLGIAVKSLATSVAVWERALGTKASPPEEVPSQRVRVQFLSVGSTHLELLEPTSPDATIAKFLEKRGEGLHHVAFHVGDLKGKLAELSAQGVRLIDAAPRQGARGRWVAFAHPSSFGGVLSEFVSDRPGGGA